MTLAAFVGPDPAHAGQLTFTGTVSVSGTRWSQHVFDITETGEVVVSLDWSEVSANLSLFLFKREPDGSWTRVAYAATQERPEQITYPNGAPGRWKVGIKAITGGSAYSVVTMFPGVPVGGSGPLEESGLVAVDRAVSAGIAGVTTSYGTYVQDVDGDGDDDFLYNRHSKYQMLLYVALADGSFVASEQFFPRNDRHECEWAYVDDDASIDFYCSVGASGGKRVKENEVWLQGVEGGFTLADGALGAADPLGRGREPAWIDATGDGVLDLFVGNFYPRKDGLPTPNRLFVRMDDGTFRPAPEFGLDREIGGQCAEPTDLDDDGDTDLAVCAHGPQGGLKLYRNDGGIFTDVAAQLGVSGAWCDARFVDLNLDGLEDLTLMNASNFKVMLARSDGSFRQVFAMSMKRSGCRFGSGADRMATGDVNLDGFPDIYVLYSGYQAGNYNLPDVFLVNDGTGEGFATASIPQAGSGSGFSVSSIQADADPQIEFLVTNGRGQIEGPIQLIDFSSSSE